jgi:SAM-dependent methyltransferase
MNWRMTTAPDWGNGAYERFAGELVEPAEHLIRIAAPQIGERAVDLGCGSGNATIPLAAAGAQVTAIDPSLRLLGLAAERAREQDFRITTSLATAEEIPLPAADADLVVSNFGVIFATDPAAAFSEVMRVLTRDGRFVFTAWVPDGALADIGKLMWQASSSSAPAAAPQDPFAPAGVAWHDPDTFVHLVPGGGDAITVHPATTNFTGETTGEWIAEWQDHHPMWLAARSRIDDEVTWKSVTDRAAELLAEGSVDDGQIVIRSPYVVVEIHPKY